MPPGDKRLLGGEDAAKSLAEQAPVFWPLIDRFGPARVDADRDVFETLVRAIANQQLSVQAGATVVSNLEALCSGAIKPGPILEAETDELGDCGLSGAKVAYVTGLAEAVDAGRLDPDALETMGDDEILDALTGFKGVGVWTAQMVLIFGLARPDVLPAGDLGVRDGARRLLDLDQRPTEPELIEIGEAWRPYRSLAAWYLWRERDRQLEREGKR